MRKGWKAIERSAASMFGTVRFKANTGGKADFESDDYVGQVKSVRVYSLAGLERLAIEMDAESVARTLVDAANRERLGTPPRKYPKIGVVVIKRSAGAGRKTPKLLVMSEHAWELLRERLNAPTS